MPTYGSANWPATLYQIFLNKGGIFDLLERVSVAGRAADGSETILTTTWPLEGAFYFPIEAKDMFLNRMNQAYESLDLLTNLDTDSINLLESHFNSFSELFDGETYSNIIFDE
eukprot:CAMPEP_0202956584 /NCGR_PEP_ID=MMETSP1396-20130829/1084_1 /ASSEMBLY_ACC=CAM_ASM_000872 /TAXON_ID= /ORGANISM="Pseudokeronopsis sp., Strain Brazil" /LENGTH=112 /DNA_ID=CAMNT_0049673667 /DNA_START=367 /DNA_END=705 /DNA_ORIENTATION=-